ncbi:Carboxypeptidase SOL1 [Senna tora]|uniref:Carboxypeptidase SOL1 n=1 Tax=Senna tora TaxID=362788 RepID=A0A834WFT1_9FABA|nr:Carboxypeptidase SOL1 [Senna tora]
MPQNAENSPETVEKNAKTKAIGKLAGTCALVVAVGDETPRFCWCFPMVLAVRQTEAWKAAKQQMDEDYPECFGRRVRRSLAVGFLGLAGGELIFRSTGVATLIVENIHLHILPSLNPDGFSLRRRGNANNIDLNRDFPDQLQGQGVPIAKYCDHCHKKGHTKDTCREIHGKPPNCKPRSRSSAAHHVETTDSQPFSKDQIEFLQKLFGQSSTVSGMPSKGHIAQSGLGIREDDWQC